MMKIKSKTLLWGVCFFTLPLYSHEIKASVGFYGNYIFQGYFDVERNDTNIRDSRIMTNGGILNLNFDRYAFFAAFAASKISINTTFSTFYLSGDLRNSELLLDFNSAFLWMVGGTYTLLKFKNLSLWTNLQYSDSRPTLNYLLDGYHSITHYFDHLEAHYYSWGVSAGTSLVIPLSKVFALTPIASLNNGSSWIILRDRALNVDGSTLLISDMQSPYYWGYSLGCLLTGGRVSLGAQASFASQTSASFTAIYLF